jgi:hypothetical protein
LIGYGSDKWWKLEAIGLMVGTVVVMAMATHQYFNAPLRIEAAVTDVGVVPGRGSGAELLVEVSFFNDGRRGITVGDVSLQLVRPYPPMHCVIPALREGDAKAGTVLSLPVRQEVRQVFRFPLQPGDEPAGLDVGPAACSIEGGLLLSANYGAGQRRTLRIGGFFVAVEHGEFHCVVGDDATLRYVGG